MKQTEHSRLIKEAETMAKVKKEKEFNFKLYAIIVFFAVLTMLVAIVYTTFTSRYTAFHSEKVAKTYVDTIVQTGDGYNAYKNSLLSVNQKYGDFIRENYMYPIIDSAAPGGVVTDGNLTDGNALPLNDDSFKGEKTLGDNGTLQGQLIDTMYPYYEELVSENGWDNYDLIFTSYFDKLVETRREIFGDDYMSDEVMFTALESNVRTYGEKLTGTEDEFDENTGMQTSFKSQGAYEKAFGDDCVITTSVDEGRELSLEAYIDQIDDESYKTYGIDKESVKAVREHTVKVSCDEKELAEVTVTLVQLGRSWYVDSSLTDTTALYSLV